MSPENSPDLKTAPPLTEPSWVWHATFESRDAGKVSVLACAETVFAVALYWWIAIRWDTHWHLISSVFVAPLLLLKTPTSIERGLRWFFKDWMGLNEAKRRAHRNLALLVLTGGLFCFYFFVDEIFSSVSELSPIVIWGAMIIALTGLFVVPSKWSSGDDATLGSNSIRRIIRDSGRNFLIVLLVAGVAVLVIETFFLVDEEGNSFSVLAFLAKKFFEMTVGISIPIAGGIALRAFFFRIVATGSAIGFGIVQIPKNWRESMFLIDSCMPAELLPGIRQRSSIFTLDGWLTTFKAEFRFISSWFHYAALFILLFIPAMLYRLNLKATCWFWWPLAYLLKPIPRTDNVGQQKQALCWPWENPWQRMLILVPALLVAAVLIFRYYNPGALERLNDPSAVSLPLKVILGTQWAYLTPWHWTMLVIVVTGLGMLSIAGNACSHKRNDNWEDFAQSSAKAKVVRMNALFRIRRLATITLLLLGLGMCLVSFPNWQKYLPDPLLHRLERFYRTQEIREQERLKERQSTRQPVTESDSEIEASPTSGSPKPSTTLGIPPNSSSASRPSALSR